MEFSVGEKSVTQRQSCDERQALVDRPVRARPVLHGRQCFVHSANIHESTGHVAEVGLLSYDHARVRK